MLKLVSAPRNHSDDGAHEMVNDWQTPLDEAATA
jgi:hypothetical protein